MSIKRFFVYSFVVHTFILVAIMLSLPIAKEKKTGEEFFIRLFSPDKFFAQAPFIPAIPKVKSASPVKARTLMHEPLPERNVSPSGHSSALAETSHEIDSRPENKGNVLTPVVPMPSIREKIFDKDIIGDLAKREFKENREEKEKTFTFDIKEMRYLGYLRRLKERIENIWIYPQEAAGRGIYGDLFIEFTIKKNGRLGAVELIRTSGHKNLDDAAIKALRDGEPYWPLPDEWGMEAYTIVGHFIYTIYGYYIR